MKKGTFFFIVAMGGALAVVSASFAQTGSGLTEERDAAYSRDAERSVNIFGPEALTDLAGQAIQEKRPDVVIVEHYKPLRRKVWIEGTTGSGYMPLSPKRVRLMEAAGARGKSVYSVLCGEQKRVIERTVGIKRVVRPVVREYRIVTRYYVRPVYIPPPPPQSCVYPVNAFFCFRGFYPFYAYGGYGRWPDRYPRYGGWAGYRYYRGGYRGYYPGAFYRGNR